LLIFGNKFQHLQYHKIEKKKILMERTVLVLDCIWILAIVGFYWFHYKFYMGIGHAFDYFLKLNSNMISNIMWCLKKLHWKIKIASSLNFVSGDFVFILVRILVVYHILKNLGPINCCARSKLFASNFYHHVCFLILYKETPN